MMGTVSGTIRGSGLGSGLLVHTTTLTATDFAAWVDSHIDLVPNSDPNKIVWPISIAASVKNNGIDDIDEIYVYWGEAHYLQAMYLRPPNTPIVGAIEIGDGWDADVDTFGFWQVYGQGNYDPHDPNLMANLAGLPLVAYMDGYSVLNGGIVASTVYLTLEGTLYQVGDVLTAVDASLTVDSVGAGGELLTYTINDPGTNISLGQLELFGGSGSGAYLDVTEVDVSVNSTIAKIEVIYRLFDVG